MICVKKTVGRTSHLCFNNTFPSLAASVLRKELGSEVSLTSVHLFQEKLVQNVPGTKTSQFTGYYAQFGAQCIHAFGATGSLHKSNFKIKK